MVTWREKYDGIADRMAADSARSGALLAGFSACVDHVYHVDDRHLQLLEEQSRRAGIRGRTATVLLDRIASGGDGEIFVDWPEGADWLAGLLGTDRHAQIGGTGPQAVWALDAAGGVGIVSLADRSADQLSVMPANALIAVPGGRLGRASDVRPTGDGKPPHIICEVSAGRSVRGATLSRSDRVIMRFNRDGIERDVHFGALGPDVLEHCAAGLISGLTAVPPAQMSDALGWLRTVAATWRDAGVSLVHFESAEYEAPDLAMTVLHSLAGLCTSIGLSLGELRHLLPGSSDIIVAMRQLAEMLGVERVQVHAERWAASVHRADPATEERALASGGLLAGLRAAHGAPRAFGPVDDRFLIADDVPTVPALPQPWRATVVPTPYVARPAGTIGLGDTFVAGSLLALMTADLNCGGPPPRAGLEFQMAAADRDSQGVGVRPDSSVPRRNTAIR